MRQNGPAPADIYAGSQLRVQRKLRNMSQTAIADGLGVTFQQVQKYENGKNRISASRLQQISKILDVPIRTFFQEGAESAPTDNAHQSSASNELVSFVWTKQGVKLNTAFLALKDPKTRRSILALVKAISELGDQVDAELD